MSIFNQFPWVKYNEYNLDWVIRTVKACQATVESALTDVSNAVATYFAQHVDTTLTQAGEAADAATVGGRFTTVNNTLSGYGLRITALEGVEPEVYDFTINRLHTLVFSWEGTFLTVENHGSLTGDSVISDIYTKMQSDQPVILRVKINRGTASTPLWYYTVASDITFIPSSGDVIKGIIFRAGDFYCRKDSGLGGVAFVEDIILDQTNAAYLNGNPGDIHGVFDELANAYSTVHLNIHVTTSAIQSQILTLEKSGTDYIGTYGSSSTVTCAADGTLTFA